MWIGQLHHQLVNTVQCIWPVDKFLNELCAGIYALHVDAALLLKGGNAVGVNFFEVIACQ